jgi:nucleoside-diphosphate-sugar epimerase
MIVSITGGTGFIGRSLVAHHLGRGDQVRVLSRRAPAQSPGVDLARTFSGDLSRGTDLVSFVDGADILYHCAAELQAQDLMHKVHVDGTHALIGAARGRIRRWVQLSSGGAYGPHRAGVIDESTPPHPRSTYECTKLESDELVESAGRRGDFEHVILRPTNVYGAQMTNQSLFALISMLSKGLFFFIGKHGASANYIHVDNVVQAMVLCAGADGARGQVLNLSDYCTIEDFMSMAAGELGVSPPRMRLPEPFVRACVRVAQVIPGSPLTESRVDALTSRAVFAIDKIQRELGYRHSVSMASGIRDLVNGWKSRVSDARRVA